MGIKMEPRASPMTLDVPSFAGHSSFAPNEPLQEWNPGHPLHNHLGTNVMYHEFDVADRPFAPFLHRTTFMSCSTSNSTGTVQEILEEYSEPYVKVVKRLVKRFTAPLGARLSMSPIAEGPGMTQESWVDDNDAPPPYRDGPYPLPGDFLTMDIRLCQQQNCFMNDPSHSRRRCMCAAKQEVPESPWVTVGGLTPYGDHICRNGVTTSKDVAVLDFFHNTVLHLLAARATPALLFRAIRLDVSQSILNSINSAGQTFLHILGPLWMNNPRYIVELLDFLVTKEFNIDSCDHYGRTFFHILAMGGLTPPYMDRMVQRYGGNLRPKRDAFNFTVPTNLEVPTTNAMETQHLGQPMDLDVVEPEMVPNVHLEPNHHAVWKQSRLLEKVGLSMINPGLEDDTDGRNGLHSLAMATLGFRSVMEKCNLPVEKQTSKQTNSQDPLNGSKQRLNLRFELVTNLLDAGVDPNHRDRYGNTPLMAFAAELPENDDYKTGPRILSLLIDRGANIHARNRAGETALHIAVRCGRKHAMKALAQHGANIHARDGAGRSLLEVADAKMMASRGEQPKDYAHHEACRAWLSGQAHAVQTPTVLQEWGIAL